ncbi:MAG: VWA domain-containing protein [Desulfobacteraceae bacterium]|nr:MAG: VWA domain-containing protein [Desulfobacteraceae bacterium]
MKRRKTSVFSVAFIDCICCGLGAMILLFVVVNSQNSLQRQRITAELRSETDRWEEELAEGRRNLVAAKNALDETAREMVRTEGLSRKLLQTLTEKRKELADRDQLTLARREHLDKLKSDLRSLEEEVKRLQAGAKREEELGRNLRPFPGQGDRQYLTGLKMGGQRILILVDASASMLDETVVGVIRRRNMATAEKLTAPKWRQAVATVDWLTANLPAASLIQIYVFNETARPLLEETAGAWIETQAIDRLNRAVETLRRLSPEKGTSLINAFEAVARISPAPDNLFLITDGLPTLGRDKSASARVSADKRLALFREAVKRLPAGLPVNTILLPMEGDPMAASEFWRLAVDTRGSFICPARDWP